MWERTTSSLRGLVTTSTQPRTSHQTHKACVHTVGPQPGGEGTADIHVLTQEFGQESFFASEKRKLQINTQSTIHVFL